MLQNLSRRRNRRSFLCPYLEKKILSKHNFQNKVFSSTDGKTNTLSTTEPEKLSTINIFPNPCEGEATISFDEAITANIEVLDMSGRNVQSKVVTEENSVKVESLGTGIYTVQIIAEDKSTITRKLIVN